MLFNSFEFLVLFLPIVLGGYFALARFNATSASAWLFAASLFFYSWFDWRYLGLLLMSILSHYAVGLWLGSISTARTRKLVLASSIAIDLGLLVYYKYSDLLIGSLNSLSGSSVPLLGIVLPIGISFFTFTQIAYLVDVYEGKVREGRLIHYGLFVTYFPHLIAGPILHHKEMMPQFASSIAQKFRWQLFSVGLSIFAIGLLKKVILADNLAVYSNAFFGGQSDYSLIQAWLGVLAYSFQLYFDFSGYSDMAIGISLMFGIKLPLNFYSPYKAKNISEFWRRWHMTLSRFLRDYLYIKLGGNRNGQGRRYFNLLATMFLGGLWHGAGWNFAVWGAMHGAYLCIQEAWLSKIGYRFVKVRTYQIAACALTFVSVVLAWVPFRASSFEQTLLVWKSLFGFNGVSIPEVVFSTFPSLANVFVSLGIKEAVGGGSVMFYGFLWIFAASCIAFFAPNVSDIFHKYRVTVDKLTATFSERASIPKFRPTFAWALITALLLFASLISLNKPSEFLYFQF
jgi:alginate O-acetyltransferase complex protein AlgI